MALARLKYLSLNLGSWRPYASKRFQEALKIFEIASLHYTWKTTIWYSM